MLKLGAGLRGKRQGGVQGARKGQGALPLAALCAGARATGGVSSCGGQGREVQGQTQTWCQSLVTTDKSPGKAAAGCSVYGGVVQQARHISAAAAGSQAAGLIAFAQLAGPHRWASRRGLLKGPAAEKARAPQLPQLHQEPGKAVRPEVPQGPQQALGLPQGLERGRRLGEQVRARARGRVLVLGAEELAQGPAPERGLE